ncbi:thioesterase of type I polyketide synthase or non-ribosomal peptide synthase like protein, partial [Herbaspirillum sp. CF444]|uniref:alpha/beta fold hydrolase n=1 Tax=Herbaspirillum sp. CF444 TaxID=1144319 RepID=UPI00027268A9
GVTDNFFEAGGDSIAALRLAEAARRHGIAGYTLELLFNFPDIAAATHAMQDQSRNFPSNILPLNAGPQSHKLFAIHPGYGLVAPYRELARHLEDRVCVYGVQSPLYAEPDWWPSSIAALAQDYTRRIRQVQPEGPYLLLGWSVGGQIATQVAAVLEAAGQQVSFLGLIDSYVRVAAPDALAPLARPPVDPAALERFMAQMAQEEPVWTRRLGQGAEGHTLAAQAMQVRDHFETLPGREHALALQVQASLWLARASLPGAAQDSVDSWRQASGAVVELQGVIDTDHTGVIHDATLLAQLHERLTQLLAGVA